MGYHCVCCLEPLVAQVAQNSGCANTFGRVAYKFITFIISNFVPLIWVN